MISNKEIASIRAAAENPSVSGISPTSVKRLLFAIEQARMHLSIIGGLIEGTTGIPWSSRSEENQRDCVMYHVKQGVGE